MNLPLTDYMKTAGIAAPADAGAMPQSHNLRNLALGLGAAGAGAGLGYLGATHGSELLDAGKSWFGSHFGTPAPTALHAPDGLAPMHPAAPMPQHAPAAHAPLGTLGHSSALGDLSGGMASWPVPAAGSLGDATEYMKGQGLDAGSAEGSKLLADWKHQELANRGASMHVPAEPALAEPTGHPSYPSIDLGQPEEIASPVAKEPAPSATNDPGLFNAHPRNMPIAHPSRPAQTMESLHANFDIGKEPIPLRHNSAAQVSGNGPAFETLQRPFGAPMGNMEIAQKGLAGALEDRSGLTLDHKESPAQEFFRRMGLPEPKLNPVLDPAIRTPETSFMDAAGNERTLKFTGPAAAGMRPDELAAPVDTSAPQSDFQRLGNGVGDFFKWVDSGPIGDMGRPPRR